MPEKEVGTGGTRTAAMIRDQTKYPIWCDGCGTDEYIFIECFRKPHWAPEGTLEVTYLCSQCQSLYGHLVVESELQDKFIAAMTATRRR